MSQRLGWKSERPATPTLTPAGRNEKLKAERVEYLLNGVPGWQAGLEQKTLVRRLEFDSHAAAASFVQWVFSLSERRSQFPLIQMQRGTVELTLGTSAVEGLTERDFSFARQIGIAGGETMKPAGSRGGQPTTSPSGKEALQS